MTVQDIAQAHYLTQKALTAAIVNGAVQDWNTLDTTAVAASWQSGIGDRIFLRVATGQMLAASIADRYVDQAAAEQLLPADATAMVASRGFAGVASDGRSLDTLLFEAVVATRAGFGAGLAPADALRRGASSLTTIVQTQVADAGRTATGAAITARPSITGWVRMLSLPSCSRCAVLAGKFFKWNHGFLRHPHCDCRHIPATEQIAGDLTTDTRKAIAAGQVTGLSEADRKAIVEDGADAGQVINARRSMHTADVYGRKLSATREGTTKRGAAARALAVQGGSFEHTPRLRPEEIYRQAGDDRGEAVRLLKRFGYLI